MSRQLKLVYESTLDDLLRAREFVGGELSQDQESVFAELLDTIWWKLSPAEQEELERRYGAPESAR